MDIRSAIVPSDKERKEEIRAAQQASFVIRHFPTCSNVRSAYTELLKARVPEGYEHYVVSELDRLLKLPRESELREVRRMGGVKVLTELDVRVMLAMRVSEAKTQKAFADAHQISEQFLSDVMWGRRPVSHAIEKTLGIERMPTTWCEK